MKPAKEIKSITEQIVKYYKPEKIILFGSFARRGEKPSSGVDLLLVESGLPLEPLVYSPREVNESLRLGDMFLKDVFEYGKVLYDKG